MKTRKPVRRCHECGEDYAAGEWQKHAKRRGCGRNPEPDDLFHLLAAQELKPDPRDLK